LDASGQACRILACALHLKKTRRLPLYFDHENLAGLTTNLRRLLGHHFHVVVTEPTVAAIETIVVESHHIAHFQGEQGRSLGLIPRQNTLPQPLRKTEQPQKPARLIGLRLTHFGAAGDETIRLHRQHLVDKLSVVAGREKFGAHGWRREGRSPSLPSHQQQRRTPERPHQTILHDSKPRKKYQNHQLSLYFQASNTHYSALWQKSYKAWGFGPDPFKASPAAPHLLNTLVIESS
jgi:hypothetical protein